VQIVRQKREWNHDVGWAWKHFVQLGWWNPQGRYSCPPRWIGWSRRWRWFLPIHSIHRPIVRQGLSWCLNQNTLQEQKSKESIQNYLVIKMSFRKVCTFFSDSQDSWKKEAQNIEYHFYKLCQTKIVRILKSWYGPFLHRTCVIQ